MKKLATECILLVLIINLVGCSCGDKGLLTQSPTFINEPSGEESLSETTNKETSIKEENTTVEETTTKIETTVEETTKEAISQTIATPATEQTTTKTAAQNGTANQSGITPNDVNTRAVQIVSAVTSSGMTEEQKVRALHDYLVKTVFYDYDGLVNGTYLREIFTPKGALVNHLAVCQGYAEGFKLLCDKAGITCEVIYGSAYSETMGQQSHAWNVVKLGDQWYQLDVTFDDPIIWNMSESQYKAGANITYAYYLVPDEIIYADHTPESINVQCTSYKYYTVTNLVNSQAEIETIIYNTLKSGTTSIYISFLQSKKNTIEGMISPALQNAVKKYVQEVGRYGNYSMNYTSGGNGVYAHYKLEVKFQ